MCALEHAREVALIREPFRESDLGEREASFHHCACPIQVSHGAEPVGAGSERGPELAGDRPPIHRQPEEVQ